MRAYKCASVSVPDKSGYGCVLMYGYGSMNRGVFSIVLGLAWVGEVHYCYRPALKAGVARIVLVMI